MFSFHFFKHAGKTSFKKGTDFLTPKTFRNSGRSMIEMLAVLAIIGVLSVAAVAGLMHALAKHKANLILHDVTMMSVDLIQDHTPGSDFMAESDVTYVIDMYDKSFTITALGVSKRVCSKLLDMNVSPFSDIYINDGDDACRAENAVHFVLSKENLGDVVPCGEKPCAHGRCINNACVCEDGWTGTYCHLLENGRCGDGTVCGPETCQPYQEGLRGTCCQTGYQAYCTTYASDGTCSAINCKPAPCHEVRFDSVGTCCQSGTTPYCYRYNTDGTCATAACMSGVCEQGRIDTLGTCCRADQTVYCSAYDAIGACTTIACATAPCTPMAFDTIGVCVPLSQFAFCNSYKTDGKCAGVSYVLSSAYATPYCTSYYPDTTQCQTGNVCYGTVTQDADGKDVCTQ